MEEGPEPHAVIEQTVEHKHHDHGHDKGEHRLEMTISAITAATLALLAAIAALLSGAAANDGMRHQSESIDTWSQYQAKSTKGHIYEAGRSVVETLGRLQGTAPERIKPELEQFEKQVKKYDAEKETIQKEARALKQQSEHAFAQHEHYALSIAAFQAGIVLASISILVRQRLLYIVSLVAGAVGLLFLLLGLLLPVGGATEHPKEHARQRPGLERMAEATGATVRG
jgi:hypothetical protein